MMGWYPSEWGWTGIAAMILMMALWVGLVVLAVWAIARSTRVEHHHVALPTTSSRAILDRRFASGELTAEQYADARRTLESRTLHETGA